MADKALKIIRGSLRRPAKKPLPCEDTPRREELEGTSPAVSARRDVDRRIGDAVDAALRAEEAARRCEGRLLEARREAEATVHRCEEEVRKARNAADAAGKAARKAAELGEQLALLINEEALNKVLLAKARRRELTRQYPDVETQRPETRRPEPGGATASRLGTTRPDRPTDLPMDRPANDRSRDLSPLEPADRLAQDRERRRDPRREEEEEAVLRNIRLNLDRGQELTEMRENRRPVSYGAQNSTVAFSGVRTDALHRRMGSPIAEAEF